jgi:hypothetical protein
MEHNRLFKDDEAVKTNALLKHKRRLFKQVSLRIDSLDKRTQNVINLVSRISWRYLLCEIADWHDSLSTSSPNRTIA